MSFKKQNFSSVVPAEFQGACYKCSTSSKDTDNVAHWLALFWKEASRYTNGPYGVCIPLTGLYNLFDVEMFVFNNDSGYIYLCFKDKVSMVKLYNALFRLKNPKKKEVEYPIYKYGYSDWKLVNAYEPRNRKDYVGYDSYLDTVKDDIQMHIEHSAYLKSIGESTHSLNYVLYGPPGVGKTSFVKVLATELNLPICLVEGHTINVNSDLVPVLNPTVKGALVLCEDFDRFFQTKVSELLNSLDGISSEYGVVRFFTCNDTSVVDANEALRNRMSQKFEFFYPNAAMFEQQLRRLLQYWEGKLGDNADTKISKIVEAAVSKKVTMRPFSTWVIRWMFKNDPLDVLLANLHQLS